MKAEFYKYAKELGISINDAQRLMMLAKQQSNAVSDEEIEKAAENYQVEGFDSISFQKGAKWMRSQLSNGNQTALIRLAQEKKELYIENQQLKAQLSNEGGEKEKHYIKCSHCDEAGMYLGETETAYAEQCKNCEGKGYLCVSIVTEVPPAPNEPQQKEDCTCSDNPAYCNIHRRA